MCIRDSRPATIALADRVAVLDGGRIVDTGSHDELLARSPRYREILARAEVEDAGVENGSLDGTVTEPGGGG